jgi:esterase/lipase superfamily enzyme
MTTVYFATNRNQTTAKAGHFGERFHADGPMFYRVGEAELDKVSEDPDEGYRVRTVTVYPEIPAADDAKAKQKLGSTALFRDLRRRIITDERDVIVLIHGFANTFVNSLQRAAQIKQAYLIDRVDGSSYEPHVVVFSWPSNGRTIPPWEYHSDRDDAAASGSAMARFMMRLLDFLRGQDGECKQRIHLVAHSMGNWAFRHAVLGIRDLLGEGQLPAVFWNAFLMAADEDEDTLEHAHKLALLPQLARAIHVYHSRGDGALVISDTTKFNSDRLGSAGPRTFSGLSNRVVAVDCSRVDFTQPAHVNHQYYRIRGEMCGRC